MTTIVVTVRPAWTSLFFLFPILFLPVITVDGGSRARVMWFTSMVTHVRPGRHQIHAHCYTAEHDLRLTVDAAAGERVHVKYRAPLIRLASGRLYVKGSRHDRWGNEDDEQQW